jgi:phospholipid transport system substrate-binding protein
MQIHAKGEDMHREGRLLHFTATIPWLIALMVYPLSAQASPSSPLQVIQSGSDRGLHIIKSSLFEGGPSLEQQRGEILRIVEEYFDFQEMSRRALGRQWKEISPEEQQEFVRLFKQLLFNTYVSRIEAGATPTTSIRYHGEKLEDRFALAKTQITGADQPDIEIDYRLLLNGTEWKVYDVVIEGISLVSNYRHQFASILNGDSFESLLQRLREKAESTREVKG